MGGAAMEQRVVPFVAGILVGVSFFLSCVMLCTHVTGPWPKYEVRDSVIYDTVYFRQPTPTNETLLGYEKVTLPINTIKAKDMARLICYGKIDTSELLSENLTKSVKFQQDSLTMQLPVTQRRYEDSLYVAWISGLRYNDYPRLDSILVRHKTVILTKYVKTNDGKRKPWSVGIGVGYGVSGKTFTPYIGLGIQYKILEF